MTWIRTVDESKAKGALKEIYREQKEKWGTVDNYTKGLSLNLSLLKGIGDLYSIIETQVGQRRHELIATIVSDINSCHYWKAWHGEALRKEMGDSGEKVVEIVRDWRSAGLNEQDQAILEFTEKITMNASGITKEDVDALRSVGLSDVDILNTTVAAGWWNFLTRYVDALGIELEEGALPDKKFVETLLQS